MSNLYTPPGDKTYCGEQYGPTAVIGNEETGILSFSSTCGYAIVNEKCNSKYEHPHPGVANTHEN